MTKCEDFQSTSIEAHLNQVAALLANIDDAYPALCARIHGDHREYLLKIESLLDKLADERWTVREEAERTLIEVGARAREMIQKRGAESDVLEVGIRVARVIKRIEDRDTKDEERQINLLRGLVLTAQHLPAEDRLLRALRSAMGHTDATVVDSAIRALGRIGDEGDARILDRMVEFKGGLHRTAALGALPQVQGQEAVDLCLGRLRAGELTPAEKVALVRDLRRREGGPEIMLELQKLADPLIADAAKLPWPAQTAGATSKAVLTLAEASQNATVFLEGEFGGFLGDTILVRNAIEGLEEVAIPLSQCDIIDFPDGKIEIGARPRMFLNQGSLISCSNVLMQNDRFEVSGSVFGDLQLDRATVQGVALDPELDRLVGGSTDHDRVRTAENAFVDGAIESLLPDTLTLRLEDGSAQTMPRSEAAGMLMTRPRSVETSTELFSRIDLTNGDRILGHIAAIGPSQLAVIAPDLGISVLPVADLHHVEFGVGGGALWGFTLIADYSDNRLVEVDEKGNVTFEMKEVYGAWDAECLDNNNILLTEFSVSRVQEMDREGNVIWSFSDLKNPYDADRLPNGNTLIADTFGGRVIEVNPDGEIIWTFDNEIRPFDVDRLANGNTLIADVIKDRVLEVSPSGEVVWEASNLVNAHDADRLPNGNTLVTLRTLNKVVEINRNGETVFEIKDLWSPSDADRLPNGHTLVAENGMVREFDRRGIEVWKKEMTWAVEVNRY